MAVTPRKDDNGDDTAVSPPTYGFLGYSEWLLVSLLTRKEGVSRKVDGMEPQQIQDLLSSSAPITLLIAGIELVFFHIFLRLFTRTIWLKLIVIIVVLVQQQRQLRSYYMGSPWRVPTCDLRYFSLLLVIPLLLSLLLTIATTPHFATISWSVVLNIGVVIPMFEEIVYRVLLLKGVLLQRLSSLTIVNPPILVCIAVGIESGLFASAHSGAGQEAWLVSFVAGVCLSLRFVVTDSLLEVGLLHMLHNLHYCFGGDQQDSRWSHTAPFLLYGGLALHSLFTIIVASMHSRGSH